MTENEYQYRESALTKISEGVEENINKMNSDQMAEELVDLVANHHLLDDVYTLIEGKYRGEGIPNNLDTLLGELVCKNVNLANFISCLGLEKTIKEKMIETYIDREARDF